MGFLRTKGPIRSYPYSTWHPRGGSPRGDAPRPTLRLRGEGKNSNCSVGLDSCLSPATPAKEFRCAEFPRKVSGRTDPSESRMTTRRRSAKQLKESARPRKRRGACEDRSRSTMDRRYPGKYALPRLRQ